MSDAEVTTTHLPLLTTAQIGFVFLQVRQDLSPEQIIPQDDA
ncbi:hypothetical protein [Singulisphaera acidiphila]|uniref:Uncharacterized protein n=1 Tax=Singulisphaera acidiphila (strain ATCC BAA-1392 / DSM 18658 / VKM B-2454 / MOB10) TaxID=886293 RepID=L0DIS5_SINAD|nr:hypothetical protein [Singulisphaera acidiphila]AGA28556.1 hypothetical protein Sinac_4360 [Singulisphaera acidiphila DSM 18658]